jgi:hypothetical protein
LARATIEKQIRIDERKTFRFSDERSAPPLLPLKQPFQGHFLACCISAFPLAAFAASPGPAVSLAAMTGEVAAAPDQAARVVASFLRSTSPAFATQEAAAATVAAIQGLGPSATAKQVGGIVFSATHAAPRSVLAIVRAAVLASPNADAPEIVTAAVSAVPDPWKKVVYHRFAPVREMGERDDKDGKNVLNLGEHLPGTPNGLGNAPGGEAILSPGDPAAGGNGVVLSPDDPGILMTLAEAIVQTAFDARSGLDQSSLITAADLALLGDPTYLLQMASDPRGKSAVGDDGNSNFGNEPVLPPIPPPVSR